MVKLHWRMTGMERAVNPQLAGPRNTMERRRHARPPMALMRHITAFALALALAIALALALAGVSPAAAHDAGRQQRAEELRALEAAEAQERETYRELKAAGALSAAQQSDYEDYLVTLRQLIEALRHQVAASPAEASPEDARYEQYLLGLRRQGAAQRDRVASLGAVSTVAGEAALGTPALTDGERTKGLDGALSASLGEFDELLLREEAAIAKRADAIQASTSAAGGASTGSAGARSLGESGREAGEADQGTPSWSDPGPETADGEQASSVERTTTADRGDRGGTGRDGRPADIPDGRDDDVVARQLREAAEKETDPELKKRLWDEYRKYKTGRR